MKKIIYIVCLLLIGIPFKGVCQNRYFDDDDEHRFIQISIGGGGFFAGRHPANFYNGSSRNVNKVSYALDNTDFVRDVQHRLSTRYPTANEGFWLDLPGRMRYSPATLISFRTSLNLSPYTSIFFQVNQVNLTATDILVVNVRDPNISEPIRIQGRIWGRESRTMLDVGFQWRDDLQARNWQWFFELGLNTTNTRVRENMIEIEGLRHTIMHQGTYHPGQGWSAPATAETAWGIGVLGSLGWRFVVNPTASLDFGVTAYLQDINLTGYKRFHTSFNLFARLNFLML
ncbi:MAG: hypothetical protein FWC94_03365 [Bacteroidales bacterium]|nr:hypothetical protein [Bacteroidales bacterium]